MNPSTQTFGDGTRIFQFLVDTILIFILAYFLYQWYNFYVYYWRFYPIRFGAFFFMTMWVYVFLFELIFLRTPAKWITGTKVVSEKGGRPNIGQFFIRACVRTTIISFFGLAWNGKPLHDTLSKTKLVASETPLV
jgi:uncharacterized RDD family membrane protein YckC